MRRLQKHLSCTGHGGQRGQSLVEFLVLAVALVPLFLLLPMIGKYQDLVQATQLASRYVAFDATSFGNADGFNQWKPPAQLADEVRRRFYSNSDAPIKTGDVAGDVDANRNLFWRDPYGHALIANFQDVAVSFGNGATTQAGGFSSAGLDTTVFNQKPFANAAAIGLAANGIYTANVSVGLANLPGGIKSVVPFDSIDLSIKRHTSLVFDPWHSPTTVKTESRVAWLAPVDSALATISPGVDLAVRLIDLSTGGAAHVEPPKFGDLSAWRDVVPADRLVPVK